jgi:hypothetical protein
MLIAFGMIGWGERVVCIYFSSLSYTQYELTFQFAQPTLSRTANHHKFQLYYGVETSQRQSLSVNQ